MAARISRAFPAYYPSELDQHLLRLCAPRPVLPPLWVHPEPLLKRAEALEVFPLVFHRLRQSPRWLPEKVSPQWEERFRANAARNLFLHTEQERLLAIQAAAGLRLFPLKGARLAEPLYGDLALRAQVDIDLYVPPQQLAAALEILEANAYRRLTARRLRPERLAATGDEFTSECTLEKTGAGPSVLLELHWRLLPLPEQELAALLATRPHLPDELEFLYLCLQASADRWGGWKMLTDLAHWIDRRPPDWERVLAAAERLGLRHILYLTLAVLLRYFELPVPEPVLERLEPARPRRLPLAAVANPFAAREVLSPAATHRLRFALRERRRDRLAYAARLLRPTAADLAAVSLPAFLAPVYWLVRWVRLLRALKPAFGARGNQSPDTRRKNRDTG